MCLKSFCWSVECRKKYFLVSLFTIKCLKEVCYILSEQLKPANNCFFFSWDLIRVVMMFIFISNYSISQFTSLTTLNRKRIFSREYIQIRICSKVTQIQMLCKCMHLHQKGLYSCTHLHQKWNVKYPTFLCAFDTVMTFTRALSRNLAVFLWTKFQLN